MNRAVFAAVWFSACAFGACSLNPQPLPPLTADDAGAAEDATSTSMDSGKSFGDAAGAMPDATPDGETQSTDAESEDAESEDAESDAAADATAD